jgi:hypothetical protein
MPMPRIAMTAKVADTERRTTPGFFVRGGQTT